MQMSRIVFGSMQRGAGKTSVMAGLAANIGKDFGYLKPFGDRLIYFKKRLWDYDSALMTKAFGLTEEPESMSIGFEHAKLRYKYDEATTKEKLSDLANKMGQGKKALFIEGGTDLVYGSSVHLDALTISKDIGAGLVIVVNGTPATIMDDLHFLKHHVAMKGLDLKGVIINKVHEIEEFRGTYVPDIQSLGHVVLGLVPFTEELTTTSVEYLVEQLFAKVVTEEGETKRVIKHIFVGAMSANAALNEAAFKKGEKLLITSGDRSDMILAAFETNTSCILLTNNILPPPNIIAKAQDLHIPILLVPWDTYETANKVHALETLLRKDDKARLELLKGLVKKHIDMKKLGL